jgi:hypothetical protein
MTKILLVADGMDFDSYKSIMRGNFLLVCRAGCLNIPMSIYGHEYRKPYRLLTLSPLYYDTKMSWDAALMVW